MLGDNLLALIKAFDYRGIPLPVVRRLARQILVALDHIHSGPRIIHTDLKPENVMLREALSPRKWRALANAAPPAAGAQGSWAACIHCLTEQSFGPERTEDYTGFMQDLLTQKANGCGRHGTDVKQP